MPLSHPFDAVVFDMDGTLLDTESVFRTIVFDVCAKLGFEMTDLVHKSIVGSSHEATQKLLVEAYGVSFLPPSTTCAAVTCTRKWPCPRCRLSPAPRNC